MVFAILNISARVHGMTIYIVLLSISLITKGQTEHSEMVTQMQKHEFDYDKMPFLFTSNGSKVFLCCLNYLSFFLVLRDPANLRQAAIYFRIIVGPMMET